MEILMQNNTQPASIVWDFGIQGCQMLLLDVARKPQLWWLLDNAYIAHSSFWGRQHLISTHMPKALHRKQKFTLWISKIKTGFGTNWILFRYQNMKSREVIGIYRILCALSQDQKISVYGLQGMCPLKTPLKGLDTPATVSCFLVMPLVKRVRSNPKEKGHYWDCCWAKLPHSAGVEGLCNAQGHFGSARRRFPGLCDSARGQRCGQELESGDQSWHFQACWENSQNRSNSSARKFSSCVSTSLEHKV